MSNVLQYSALSIIRCLYFAVLLVPGFASTAKAQEPDCAEFETLREGLRAILRDYRQHDDPRFLHDLVAASRTARACARTDGERIVTYDYESWTLGALDRLEDAVEVLEAATRLAPPAEEYSSAWVNVYGRLADMLFRLGRFAETQHVYAQALRHTESRPLGRRLRLYTQHANALAQMSAYDEAMERLVEIEALIEAGEAELSREEYEGWLGRVLFDQADILTLQSSARHPGDEEKLERAIVLAERAIELQHSPDYWISRRRVLSMLVVADALDKLGRTDEARARYREAVRAADAHGDVGLRAQAWSDLGEHHLALAEPDAALPPLQRALGFALEDGDDYEAQYTYSYIGQAYQQQGRLDEAEAAFREAIARAERHRASLGMTDLAATAFAAWQGPYRRLVGVYLQAGRPREAFTLLEQTRARHLHDLRRDRRERVGLSDAGRARLDSLDAEIERLRAALATEPDPAGLLGARLTERVTERYGPDADAAAYAPPSLEDVQRALGRRGQTLVSYFLSDSSTAFVVTAEDFRAVPLGVSEAEVDSLVQAVSALWRGEADAPSRHAIEFDTGALHALYRAVFAPVREHVEDGAPLVIIPDGRLREISFAMLLEEPTPRFQYSAAPYLLRRHPITTDLAAALLTDTTGLGSGQPLDLLAFGRSEFALPADLPRGDGEAPLPDLPVVRDELRALRSLFRRGVVMLDAEATEADLRRRLPEARVVHLASHANVDAQRPLYSHVELWPDSTEDGRLHLYELAGHHLPAELVVLSGCSTARGQVLRGEGMLGLHYGFRAAGSEASLGTLWYVDDEATGALMTRFYRHLRAGLPKDRALQRAQLDVLDAADGLRASPFFWAAPVLYGSPAAIEWADPPGLPPAVWTAIGAGLLLLGLGLPRLRRRA